MGVTPQHSAIPDGRALAYRHVAHQRRRGRHKGGVIDRRLAVEQVQQCAMSTHCAQVRHRIRTGNAGAARIAVCKDRSAAVPMGSAGETDRRRSRLHFRCKRCLTTVLGKAAALELLAPKQPAPKGRTMSRF